MATRGQKLDVNLPEIAVWYLNFLDEYHYAPTVREVCKYAGVKSTATGFRILRELVDNGYINGIRTKRGGGKKR